MADPDCRRVILYKRWLLRDGVGVDQVAEVVLDAIVPMYRRLSEDVELGLELSTDQRSVLTIQRWRCRNALVRAMSGPGFESWWSEYQPILSRWDAMLALDSEWETVELIAWIVRPSGGTGRGGP